MASNRPKKRANGKEYHKATKFIERGSMANFSAGLICDVVGVVTFVSRELREKKTNSMSFWLSKWIHLHDGTSPFPIILHVYACSQPEIFSTILPGMVLVCARMVLRIEPHDSRHQKFCFLTTTRESQLYLLKQPSDVDHKPFSGCDSVRDLIKWRQSHEAKQLLRVSCTGGLYSFPPLPVALESYKRLFPADNPIELTNTVHLGVVFQQLHFRQYLRLHIQGVVAAVEFVPLGGVTESSQSSGVTSCSDSQQNVVSSDSMKKKATLSWDETRIGIRNATTSSSGESSDKHEPVSGSSRKDIAEHQNVKRRFTYERRVNPPRSCKRARRRSSRELYSTSSCEGNSNRTQERHKIKVGENSDLTAQRVNPRRKCRKDVPRYSRSMKKAGRREEASPVQKEEILRKNPPKKSKNRSSKDLLPASSGRDGIMDSTSRESHHNVRLVVGEKNELQQVTKTGSYFPFRILDRQWIKNAPSIPTWGMSHCHRDTFPRLCSRERSGDVVFPRADRQGFVDAEGYWRLLIMGLNRQAVISALFMPQYSDTDAPEDGTFLSALATGEIPKDFPIETLLDRASKEMKTRRMVFVLDVYCHEQDQVEVVINRAY